MDKKKTGKLIRDARIQKNLTQAELGDLLGVTNKAISRWENGDAFPDISIIENISIILDIRIQDIVTGELESKEDNAITEVIRYSKLQLAGRKKAMIENSLAIILLVICAWIGYFGLSGKTTYWFYHTNIDFVLILILTEIIFLFLYRSRNNENESCDLVKRKVFTILSSITLIFGIIAPYISVVMVAADNNPFGMPDSKVGPFVSFQLQVVFWINIVLISYGVYRFIRYEQIFYFENYISLLCIFISVLWYDLLNRMADAKAVFYSIHMRAVIVAVNAVVIFVVLIFNKKNNVNKITDKLNTDESVK